MKYNRKRIIVIHPNIQNLLTNNLPRDHIELIYRDIRKIRRSGLNVLKILKVVGRYLLTEVKHHRPPYRLYVVVDQGSNIFVPVDWAHKKDQERIINRLSSEMKNIIEWAISVLSSQGDS